LIECSHIVVQRRDGENIRTVPQVCRQSEVRSVVTDRRR
jgi:hypothetical protein